MAHILILNGIPKAVSVLREAGTLSRATRAIGSSSSRVQEAFGITFLRGGGTKTAERLASSATTLEKEAAQTVGRASDQVQEAFGITFRRGKAPSVATPEGVVFEAPAEIGDATLLARQTQKARGTAKKAVKLANKAEKAGAQWTPHGFKHSPPKNVPWKKTIQSTVHGAAKYKPGINIKELEFHVWKYGQKATNGKNWKVFKCSEIIGAKSGKETCFMRIECSGNTIHGHPILESEYLDLLK